MGGRPNTHLRARERGSDLRDRGPSGEVSSRKVDPEALGIALGFAGGDQRLLEISNDGMSITVRNQPTRR